MAAMGENTRIEWADHTFNPWTGCQKVSPACDHCYAEATAKRAPSTFGGWGPGAERKRTSESYWRQPLLWSKRAAKAGTRPRVFCASMADIMDKAAPIEWFVDAIDLMRVTPHLIWLLLTKRPQMIRQRLEAAFAHLAKGTDRGDLLEWIAGWLQGLPPENIWLGITAENQDELVRRTPHVLAVPAAKRFLSMEPLLGPVRLDRLPHGDESDIDALRGEIVFTPQHVAVRPEPLGARIDWVIAGGESGPKARPSHPDWFRSLRDQCQAAGVPFFFKQWGEWREAPWKLARRADESPEVYKQRSEAEAATHFLISTGEPWPLDHKPWSIERDDEKPAHAIGLHRIGKKTAGALLDGREWREVPSA